MATSGSFNTGSVGNFYFTFEWSRTGYNSSKNEHYISYTLKAHNSAGKYRTVYAKKLVINGTTVFEEAGTSGNGKAYYDGDVVTSGSRTISSSNSAGDGSLNVSFEAGVGQYPSTNCSGNGSWGLDRIPRYTSITSFSVANISGADGLTKVKFNWSASDSCDWAWYSTDNGGSWHDLPNTNIVSGLSPNTSYNFKLRVRRTDSQLTTDSNKVTKSTYNIATITSHTSNFSVNSNKAVKCTVNNPSGASMKYFVDLPNGTRRYTSSATTEKSYTWTAAEILALLQYIPNDNSSTIKFGVATLVNGNETYWHGIVGTLNVVDSNPIFSDYTYADINNTTLALTGNNQIIINNYSNLKVTISTANKAIAQNSATMKNYKLICGTKNISKDYSSSADVELSLNNIDSSTITVYATDSRGNSTSKAKTSTFKNYTDLAITKLTATRQQNGVGSAVLLEFEGTYWNNSFGAVTNAIQQCIYKYKLASSSTWITGETQLSYSASNGTFSGSMLINGDLGTDGFNVANAYNIRLQMADKLVTKAVDITLPSGAPGLAIAKKGIAIKQKYNSDLGGALQVNGIIYALDSDTGNFIDIVKKIKELASN